MKERVIGAFAFPTKKAAECEIRRILHENPLDTPLSGGDAELIESLLGVHPDAAAKIGAGVERIEVRRIDYGSRGFWVTRVDGTQCDFSYRTALNGVGNHKAEVRRAMRQAIRSQVDEFRRVAFTDGQGSITCPLTGQAMALGPWAHVDHIVDFAVIADVFAEQIGGYDQVPIGKSSEHPGSALTEPCLSLWRQFHQSVAQLRVVHASANLARYKQGTAA